MSDNITREDLIRENAGLVANCANQVLKNKQLEKDNAALKAQLSALIAARRESSSGQVF